MTDPRHALWELTLARLREFLREPAALFWTFGFPVLLAVGLGVAFRNRPAEAFDLAVVGTGPDAERVFAVVDEAPNVAAERCAADVATDRLHRGKVPLVVEVAPGSGGPRLNYRYDSDNDEGRSARLVVD